MLQGLPPLKKEGEKKDDHSNSIEGKGIAARILGPFKPASISSTISSRSNNALLSPLKVLNLVM